MSRTTTALRLPLALLLAAVLLSAARAANPEDALLDAVGMGDKEALRNGLRQMREYGESAFAFVKAQVEAATGAPAAADGSPTAHDAAANDMEEVYDAPPAEDL